MDILSILHSAELEKIVKRKVIVAEIRKNGCSEETLKTLTSALTPRPFALDFEAIEEVTRETSELA